MSSENNKWKFPKIYTIGDRKFDPDLEKFVTHGIDGLVRENIQNSLDHKLLSSAEPVNININIGEMSSSDVPGINELRERVNTLSGGNVYAKSTVEYIYQKIKSDICNYISFEDNNTKGLSEKTWDIYAYEKGSHFVEADKNLEDSRGGSHGVGKIASNAASDIHMMLFSNCDEFGTKRIGGTIHLLEHEYNNQIYRSTGYFTDGDETKKFIAYENHNPSNEIFRKDTRGLKIIIPFLRDEFLDKTAIIRSVCDNFFVAILNNKLVVRINDISIDSSNIKAIINNSNYYNEDLVKKNKVFTLDYINTYTNSAPTLFTISDKNLEEYNFNLYSTYDESLERCRVGIIRSIGMKIEDHRVTGHSKSSFNCVLIPTSSKEDKFLKSLENESHTKLGKDHIRDEGLKSNATRFLNNLDKKLSEYFTSIIKEKNPADGAIDTKSLIYTVEHNFKSDLETARESVMITGKNKSTNHSIIKRSTNRSTSIAKETPKDYTVTKPREKAPLGSDSKKNKIEVFEVPQNRVKRLVIGNTEKLHINIANHENYNKETICNIHMKLIDGEGEILDELFNLNQLYTTSSYIFRNNTILNVPIENGKIFLNLQIKPNVNSEIKFIYYLEV